ncbi:hypothetical protein [Sanguibacter keddieii]|uniref:hypothetical protein n=1 Tax=Sanguibacter keddieii TaxID=60920 RepID=UPI00065F969A|nr:hypothetical protein [Sanguibacter keddieii]
MSNLGAYQMVTTGIKALGGPAKAGLIAVGSVVALTGSVYRFGVNRGVNMGDRQTIEAKVTEWVRSRFAQFNAHELSEVYTVSADVECGGGLMLRAGDRFRVGKVIDDMVYIEVEGSDDNPFIVSVEQLGQHSDYPAPIEKEIDLPTHD